MKEVRRNQAQVRVRARHLRHRLPLCLELLDLIDLEVERLDQDLGLLDRAGVGPLDLEEVLGESQLHLGLDDLGYVHGSKRP